jgi:hypothetical protein
MLKKIVCALLIALPLTASAGKLLNCDQISTSQGIRYVGTYCMDYRCTYVKRVMFSSWCPYSI